MKNIDEGMLDLIYERIYTLEIRIKNLSENRDYCVDDKCASEIDNATTECYKRELIFVKKIKDQYLHG